MIEPSLGGYRAIRDQRPVDGRNSIGGGDTVLKETRAVPAYISKVYEQAARAASSR